MSKNLGVIDDPVREKLFKQLEELSLFGDRIKYLILSSRGILQNPIEVFCERSGFGLKFFLFWVHSVQVYITRPGYVVKNFFMFS